MKDSPLVDFLTLIADCNIYHLFAIFDSLFSEGMNWFSLEIFSAEKSQFFCQHGWWVSTIEFRRSEFAKNAKGVYDGLRRELPSLKLT